MIKKVLICFIVFLLPLSLPYSSSNSSMNGSFVMPQDTIIKRDSVKKIENKHIKNDSIINDVKKKDSIVLNKRNGFVITLERRKITTLSVKKNK